MKCRKCLFCDGFPEISVPKPQLQLELFSLVYSRLAIVTVTITVLFKRPQYFPPRDSITMAVNMVPVSNLNFNLNVTNLEVVYCCVTLCNTCSQIAIMI